MTFTITRPNTDANGAANNNDLARDVYYGIVFKIYRVALESAQFIATKVLQRGQSSITFYANGKTTIRYIANNLSAMTQGAMDFGKLTISPDDELYADNVVSERDERETPITDLATRIGTEQGEALKLHADKIGFLALAKAAGTSAILPDLQSGLEVTGPAVKTDVAAFIETVKTAVATRANQGIHLAKEGAKIVVGPDLYYTLCNNKDFIDRQLGGVGGFISGQIERLFGLYIIMSSNIPSADLSDNTAITAAGENPNLILDKYRGDYSKLAALILTPVKNGVAAVAKVVEADLRVVPGIKLLDTGHGILGKRWSVVEQYGMEVFDPSYAVAIYEA